MDGFPTRFYKPAMGSGVPTREAVPQGCPVATMGVCGTCGARREAVEKPIVHSQVVPTAHRVDGSEQALQTIVGSPTKVANVSDAVATTVGNQHAGCTVVLDGTVCQSTTAVDGTHGVTSVITITVRVKGHLVICICSDASRQA